MSVYFYPPHETAPFDYTVLVRPPPADDAKAVFHRQSASGDVIHTEKLVRSGSGTLAVALARFDPRRDSPVFIDFVFAKKHDRIAKAEQTVRHVISLAEPEPAAIEPSGEAHPQEDVELKVTKWAALAFDRPGQPTAFPESNPARIPADLKQKVRWVVDGEELSAKGESVKWKPEDAHAGKTVDVKAFIREEKNGAKGIVKVSPAPEVTCSDVEGPHFDFDRSFVRPEGIDSLAAVHQKLADPKKRGMIFGHTDTVGTEEYNKLLSERRARAVLAALTHDADGWEKLQQQESWGLKPTQTMLNVLLSQPGELAEPLDPDGKDGPKTKAAVKTFQKKNGLDPDGVAGKNTRRALFLAYFKRASETPLGRDRFKSFGAEGCMGCGEYNPFSADGADEASRRVTIQIFDPKAEPKDLPCVIGDVGPCRKNLLAKGEAPADGDPKMANFRCKVFREIAKKCCGCEPGEDPGLSEPSAETEERPTIALKLFAFGRVVAKNVEATVTAGEARAFGKTNEEGILQVPVPEGATEVRITYSPADSQSLVSVVVKLDLPPADSEEGALGRLENLGYPARTDRDFALFSFQRDFDLPVTADLDDATKKKLTE
ncbi:MAG: peptidoglycan-binding protein, partial [Planctomycetota bacterium]